MTDTPPKPQPASDAPAKPAATIAENLKQTASTEADAMLAASDTVATQLVDKASVEAERLLTAAFDTAERLKQDNIDKALAIKETAKLLAVSIKIIVDPFREALAQHLIAANRSIALAEEALSESKEVRKIVEALARKADKEDEEKKRNADR